MTRFSVFDENLDILIENGLGFGQCLSIVMLVLIVVSSIEAYLGMFRNSFEAFWVIRKLKCCDRV